MLNSQELLVSVGKIQEALDDVSDRIDEGRSYEEFIVNDKIYAI